jgi:RNA polymerase sigma-70 factor (ECF subfamily)
VNPDESQLFRAWREGDAPAFDRLYAATLPRLTAYCRLLARDEDAAAELFQDTWRRAIAAAGACQGSVGAWLASIAHNLWIDRVRRRAAEQGALSARREGTREWAGGDPGAGLDARAFLDRLDPEEREIALLYYVQEMSMREIARAVGLTHPTVRARLLSAHQKWDALPKAKPDSSTREEA